MNMLYTINTLLIFIVHVITFKKISYLKYIKISTILLLIRNGIRLFDYEQTKTELGTEAWTFLVAN